MDNEKLKDRINKIINNDIYTEYPPFPKKGMLIEVTNLCNDSLILNLLIESCKKLMI